MHESSNQMGKALIAFSVLALFLFLGCTGVSQRDLDMVKDQLAAKEQEIASLKQALELAKQIAPTSQGGEACGWTTHFAVQSPELVRYGGSASCPGRRDLGLVVTLQVPAPGTDTWKDSASVDGTCGPAGCTAEGTARNNGPGQYRVQTCIMVARQSPEASRSCSTGTFYAP